MVRIIIVFVFICMQLAARGQQFAPLGAEWYHEMQFGIFHSAAVADTLIDGEPCRKITQKAGRTPFYTFMGPFVYDMPTLYMHSNGTGDTVFAFNEFFNRFTPVYIFNVQPGDTMCLPVLPPHGGVLMSVTDSSFCFVVDSTKTVQYDTTWLETVYARSLSIPGHAEYSYNGPYARRIGRLNGGILPDCHTCSFPLTDAIQQAGALRCYHDENTAIKLVNDTCSKGIKVSVDDFAGNEKLKIFPNPAKDKLMLQGTAQLQRTSVNIIDIHGRAVLYYVHQPNGNDIAIDISTLAPGIYILQLSVEESSKKYARFIVQP